jgi:hypothetical protein
LVAVALGGDDQLPGGGDPPALPGAQAGLGLVGQRGVVGQVPAQDGLGGDLVDVLPARAARADKGPIQLVVGDVDLIVNRRHGPTHSKEPFMDEQGTNRGSLDRTPALPGRHWGDLRWLALLVVLTAAMRLWQLRHTEVTSRDSVGFIAIAWRLGHEDCRVVLPDSDQHPGYPAAVLALSGLVAKLATGDLARTMQLSAQLVSALASVLLVVPMFYLGRELFNRRVGFWATLLFQCIPASGILLADGLSEALFLLFCLTALLFGMRSLRTGSAAGFAVCGLCGGLAYLTRVEGALIPAATGVVLLAGQVVPARRRAWRLWAVGALALGVGALAVATPYMVAIRGVTVKPTALHMTGRAALHTPPPAVGCREPLPFALWNYRFDVGPQDRYGWALKALGMVFVRGTFYCLWLPALLGLWWFRDRFRVHPGAPVLLVLWLVLLGLLYRVAQAIGYIGERHMVLAISTLLYWAVAALGVLAPRLAAAWGGLRFLRQAAQPVTLALLAALAVAPLGRTLATLHADRAAFRRAGDWLARHARPEDRVVDPYAWAAFYGGRTFLENPAVAPVYYVVLEESDNRHEHLWHHMAEAVFVAKAGQPVARFPVKRRKNPGEVVVYRWNRP